MRRLILVLLLLHFVYRLYAQHYKRSAGLRAGVPYGFTYKQIIKKHNAFEVYAATRWTGGISFGTLWLTHYDPDIYPGVLVFAGGGVESGFWNDNSDYINGPGAGWAFGITASVGAEYEFDTLPLSIGLDWIPMLNLLENTVFDAGRIGVSLRYLF